MRNSGCINIAAGECAEGHGPGMATYVKLRKWVEPGAESTDHGGGKESLLPSSSTRSSTGWHGRCGCREKCLRSHACSKKETAGERTSKWLKENKKGKVIKKKKKNKKASSCFSFRAALDCLLSCVVRVDVVEYTN